MPTISSNNKFVTLINTFTIKPERQSEVIQLLQQATEEVMKKLPGFISATIHKSLDGTKVANYAQWRSLEDFQAIFQNSEATAHMQQIMQICEKFEPILYTVESCHE